MPVYLKYRMSEQERPWLYCWIPCRILEVYENEVALQCEGGSQPCEVLGPLIERSQFDGTPQAGDRVCVTILCGVAGEAIIRHVLMGECPAGFVGCDIVDPARCGDFFERRAEHELDAFVEQAVHPSGCSREGAEAMRRRAIALVRPRVISCCRQDHDPGECIREGIKHAGIIFGQLRTTGFCRDRGATSDLTGACAELVSTIACLEAQVGSNSPCERIDKAIAQAEQALDQSECRDRRIKREVKYRIDALRRLRWLQADCEGEPAEFAPGELDVPC